MLVYMTCHFSVYYTIPIGWNTVGHNTTSRVRHNVTNNYARDILRVQWLPWHPYGSGADGNNFSEVWSRANCERERERREREREREWERKREIYTESKPKLNGHDVCKLKNYIIHQLYSNHKNIKLNFSSKQLISLPLSLSPSPSLSHLHHRRHWWWGHLKVQVHSY